MSTIAEEIKKRRTFAIISHPDAGKTTLTEKFLLYGGAINLAGTVKGLSLIHIFRGPYLLGTDSRVLWPVRPEISFQIAVQFIRVSCSADIG